MWMTVQPSGSLVSWGCHGPVGADDEDAVGIFQVRLDGVGCIERMCTREVHVQRHPIFEYRCADVFGDSHQCRLILRGARSVFGYDQRCVAAHQQFSHLAQTVEWARPVARPWSCRPRGASDLAHQDVERHAEQRRAARHALGEIPGAADVSGKVAAGLHLLRPFRHRFAVAHRPGEIHQRALAIPGRDRGWASRRGSACPVRRSPWGCVREKPNASPWRHSARRGRWAAIPPACGRWPCNSRMPGRPREIS